jgi:hypothetical protein
MLPATSDRNTTHRGLGTGDDVAGQEPGDEPGKPETVPASDQAVDIQGLADRVYRLMLRDVRLAQARSAIRRRKE